VFLWSLIPWVPHLNSYLIPFNLSILLTSILHTLVTDSWSWYIQTLFCCWTCWRILWKVWLLPFLIGRFHFNKYLANVLTNFYFFYLACGNKSEGNNSWPGSQDYERKTLIYVNCFSCFCRGKMLLLSPQNFCGWSRGISSVSCFVY
jgi:hypothetical protein